MFPHRRGLDPKNLDQKHIASFISNSENTMNEVVSNSVGMVLLKLKEKYLVPNQEEKQIEESYQKKLEQKSDELQKLRLEGKKLRDLDAAFTKKLNVIFETCIKEIKEISQSKEMQDYINSHPDFKKTIAYIIDKTNEPWGKFDIVTLWLPTTNNTISEQATRFTLKETFVLTWMALNDDKAFIQNYEGDDQKKIADAKRERIFRFRNFFDCLERIRTVTVCHHGNRNEIVFTLNGIYQDINLIEDARSTVQTILRDEISKEFWKKYKDEKIADKEKKELVHDLFEWMETANVTSLFNKINQNNYLTNHLKRLFITHGSNPERVKLNNLINETISYLVFSCNPKDDPIIYKLNYILNYPDLFDKAEQQGLEQFKSRILKEFDFNNSLHQEKIKDFYTICVLNKLIQSNRGLLLITDQMTDDVTKIERLCHDYFISCKEDKNYPLISEAEKHAEDKLCAKIEGCKKDNINEKVADFFIRWNFAKDERDVNKLKVFYNILLNDIFKEKIVLLDKDIKKYFLESKDKKGHVDMDAYIINRFFLHVLLVETSQWSTEFKSRLKEVIAFVEKRLQGGVSEEALRQSSYPPILINQIKYLDHKSNPDVKEAELKDLPTMIMLPHFAKKLEDWLTIFTHADENNKIKVFNIYATKIIDLMSNCKIDKDLRLFKNVFVQVPSICKLRILRASIHLNTITNNFKDYYSYLSDDHKLDFITSLDVDILDKIITSRTVWTEVISYFSSNGKKQFLSYFYFNTKKFNIDLEDVEYLVSILKDESDTESINKLNILITHLPRLNSLSNCLIVLNNLRIRSLLDNKKECKENLIADFISKIPNKKINEIVTNWNCFSTLIEILPKTLPIEFIVSKILEKLRSHFLKTENLHSINLFYALQSQQIPSTIKNLFVQSISDEDINQLIDHFSERLVTILPWINKSKRISFVTDFIKSFQDGTLYSADSLFSSIKDIMIALEMLSEYEKKSVIEKILVPKIRNLKDLIAIFDVTENQFKLDFIQLVGIEKIKQWVTKLSELELFMLQVPADSRVSLLNQIYLDPIKKEFESLIITNYVSSIYHESLLVSHLKVLDKLKILQLILVPIINENNFYLIIKRLYIIKDINFDHIILAIPNDKLKVFIKTDQNFDDIFYKLSVYNRINFMKKMNINDFSPEKILSITNSLYSLNRVKFFIENCSLETIFLITKECFLRYQDFAKSTSGAENYLFVFLSNLSFEIEKYKRIVSDRKGQRIAPEREKSIELLKSSIQAILQNSAISFSIKYEKLIALLKGHINAVQEHHQKSFLAKIPKFGTQSDLVKAYSHALNPLLNFYQGSPPKIDPVIVNLTDEKNQPAQLAEKKK